MQRLLLIIAAILCMLPIVDGLAYKKQVPLEVIRVQKKAGKPVRKVSQPPPKLQITISPKAVQPARPYRRLTRAIINSGSLRWNVIRLAHHYGWREVVWNAPTDYRWVGRTAITGNSVTQVMATLLHDYPLQAVFYQGNHVLEIRPRTLR